MEQYLLPKIVDHGGNLTARWYVEYKYKHPETNKYVKFREWISTKLNTRQARYHKGTELKRELTIKLKSGFNPFETESFNKNIVHAFNEVLQLKATINGSRSKTDYKSISNTFLNWLQKNNYNNLRANDINKIKAQSFCDYLLVTKKLSARTFNNYLACMRTVFACFMEREIVNFNVWQSIKKLKVKQTNLNFYTDQERETIKQNLPNDNYPLYCVMLLIYYCFLRPAEIVRLQISDIDFNKNQIIIKGTASKNGKTQIVVMHPFLVNALQQLELNKYPSNYFVFATTKQLLPSSKQIAPTRISDAWRWIVKEKYSIKKNIYDFKPTGVNSALESGIHAREIQLQIRHHSLEQTQIYLDKISNEPGQVFREKMQAF